MSNYRRLYANGGTYFFTVVTYRRQRFLCDEPCRRWLREAIIYTRQRYPFKIDAWVLLPDHLHCVWTLPENDNDFSTRWNIIKKRFTQAAKSALHQASSPYGMKWNTGKRNNNRHPSRIPLCFIRATF